MTGESVRLSRRVRGGLAWWTWGSRISYRQQSAASSAGPLHCLVRQDRSLLASDAPSHDTFESTSGQDIDSNGYGACRSISATCSEQLTIADMAKPVATASLTSFCKVDVREVARS